MARKKSAATRPSRPRSFAGVIRGHSRSVQHIATALRDVVFEELPDAQEAFYGGHQAMAIYRTTAEVCWIQPLKERCNIYFMCGPELTDAGHDLEGTSNRHRHAKIRSTDDVERLPLCGSLRESVALNNVAISGESASKRCCSDCRRSASPCRTRRRRSRGANRTFVWVTGFFAVVERTKVARAWAWRFWRTHECAA